MLVAHVTCMLYEGCNTIGAHLTVKVITYNDIHLPIDPMYLNVAVLFISEYPLHCCILEIYFSN